MDIGVLGMAAHPTGSVDSGLDEPEVIEQKQWFEAEDSKISSDSVDSEVLTGSEHTDSERTNSPNDGHGHYVRKTNYEEKEPFLMKEQFQNKQPYLDVSDKSLTPKDVDRDHEVKKSFIHNTKFQNNHGHGKDPNALIKHDDEEDQQEKDTPNSCYNVCSTRFWVIVIVHIVFLIFDVLLIVSIIYVLKCGHPAQTVAPTQEVYCLKCNDVYLSRNDVIDNIYNFNISEGGECCSNNSTFLIQKYVLKRYIQDSAQVSSKKDFPRREAVHLELDLGSDLSTSESVQALKWSKTTGALISGELTLSDNRSHIRVLREGQYFLSARVTFQDKEKDLGEDVLPMLLQVYKVTGSEPRLLLEDKQTHCAKTDAVCSIPSSVQGVFRFAAGESVYVNVRMPCGLVEEKHLNHFDMYLI